MDKPVITTTHVPGGRCPNCGTALEACSGRNGKGPVPGNPLICFECGAIHTIDEDGTYRGFTPEELEAIADTPGYMEELVAMQARVLSYRAKKN